MTEEMIQKRFGTEALSKTREAFEKIDFDKLMHFLVEMLAVFGELSVKLGQIEEENKDVTQLLKMINSNPKLFLSKMIEKATAEEVKTLMQAMLRFDELSPKLADLVNLTITEKKNIGNELISLSKVIDEAYKKTRKKR